MVLRAHGRAKEAAVGGEEAERRRRLAKKKTRAREEVVAMRMPLLSAAGRSMWTGGMARVKCREGES